MTKRCNEMRHEKSEKLRVSDIVNTPATLDEHCAAIRSETRATLWRDIECVANEHSGGTRCQSGLRLAGGLPPCRRERLGRSTLETKLSSLHLLVKRARLVDEMTLASCCMEPLCAAHSAAGLPDSHVRSRTGRRALELERPR